MKKLNMLDYYCTACPLTQPAKSQLICNFTAVAGMEPSVELRAARAQF